MNFLRKNWFLIGLVAVLVLGSQEAERLMVIADRPFFRELVVASVMFLMALPLQGELFVNTLLRPQGALLASGMNYICLPLVALGLYYLLPEKEGLGLLVVAVVPSTLASAAVWTRRAGGNEAVAIMVTVLTNGSCFLATPLGVWLLIGQRVEIDLGVMVQKLFWLVLLPIIAAQLARQSSKITMFSKHYKSLLSTLAQCGILYIVLVGAVTIATPAGGADLEVVEGGKKINTVWGPKEWLGFGRLIAVTVGLHLIMWFFSFGCAKRLGFKRADQIAIGFSGSQKTLMVGLYIASVCHVTILPMIIYHVGQLFADTFLADWLKRKGSVLEEDNE
ncbi:MAG: bile acid:sodium symporter [Pirellulaceae bacterium]|nr:bile acid:sodium symporter [Pirellulaceae bacterium]